MSTLQLLVDDKGNREALSELLQQQYVIEVGDELGDVDLYLVDDQTIPKYRDALIDRKQAEHPTFCPVVLIQREDTQINVELPTTGPDAGPTIIDDIVTAPVDKPLLFRRLSNLLIRRSQSITQARQYEESEARFKGLFQTIPDPAFVLDGDRTIIQINDAFCQLTGMRREEAINRDPADIEVFTEETGTQLRSILAEERGDEQSDATVVFEDAAGDQRYAEIRTQTDTVRGESITTVVMHDVTKLTEQNERLERFASIVSHDLRNPLQVARGRLEMVDSSDNDEEHIEAIFTSLDRMNEIIEDVRTLVSENERVDPEPLELAAVVREAWQNVATDESDLELTECGMSLVADRRRLLQLLENLFRNAREHGGSGVTVSVGTIPNTGFFVADDGPGIPPAERDDVFEAGYTTESGGTGLGLKIVSEIVDIHDWSIEVVESVAGGARFEISDVQTSPG